MTLTGTLTDYEGDIARINDEPKKMLPAAAKWCKDRLKKGMTVDYDLVADGEKKGYIAKLWERKAAPSDSEDKRKAAGFGQPAGESKENCTSSGTPAGNGLPKTIEGKISVITPDARTFNLWREDFKLKITWMPGQDAAMAKFKQWDPVKVTYEPGTVNKLVDIVGEKKKGGWGGGQPRNEKAIILQYLFKGAVDLYVHSVPPGEKFDIKAALKDCRIAAQDELGEFCKAGGVT